MFPLRLHFTYLRNVEDKDLLTEEIKTLHLFLFDESTGQIKASRTVETNQLSPGNTLEWKVPKGSYTLVTWGGVMKRYVISDENQLSAMRLSLPVSQAGVVTHEKEHLWHSADAAIRISGDLTTTIDVDLRKMSNDVKVNVTSTSGELSEHAESYIICSNGLLGAYGIEIEESTPLRYHPDISTTRGVPASVHSYTLLGLHDGDDSFLDISLNGANIYQGSLSGLILLDPLVDIELQDEFDIEFKVDPRQSGDASVGVSVNGWKVVEYNVSLR